MVVGFFKHEYVNSWKLVFKCNGNSLHLCSVQLDTFLIIWNCLVFSDGTPSTAIGDIYIPDPTLGSKLKVKFASGKSFHAIWVYSVSDQSQEINRNTISILFLSYLFVIYFVLGFLFVHKYLQVLFEDAWMLRNENRRLL